MTKLLVPTGERFIPEMSGPIVLEHMHRYAVATTLAKGKRVLDVACGEGYGSAMLARVADSVVGVDISEEAIAHAQDRYRQENLGFLKADCTEIPLDDASVDLISCFETIEHHDKQIEMLVEFSRVLAPDGVLIISSPNKATYAETAGAHNEFHVKELYLDDFRELLDKCFPRYEIYTQRVVYASMLSSLNAKSTAYNGFRAEGNDLEMSDAVYPAIYFLAVATRTGQLPELSLSTYESADVSPETGRLEEKKIFEVKIFWRDSALGPNGGYSEKCSHSILYEPTGEQKSFALRVTKCPAGVARLRLDISNTPCIVDVYSMSLRSPEGRTLWQWSGDFATLGRRSQVFFLEGFADSVLCTAISTSDDPWVELDLPDSVYAELTENCTLHLDLASHHLLGRLPKVVEALAKGLSTKQASMLPLKGAEQVSGALQRACELRASLEAVSGLVDERMGMLNVELTRERRDSRVLREQLIRAEAQLELLKEIAGARLVEGWD